MRRLKHYTTVFLTRVIAAIFASLSVVNPTFTSVCEEERVLASLAGARTRQDLAVVALPHLTLYLDVELTVE